MSTQKNKGVLPKVPTTSTCKRCGCQFSYERTTSPRTKCDPCIEAITEERRVKKAKHRSYDRTKSRDYKKLIPYAGYDPAEDAQQRARFYTG